MPETATAQAAAIIGRAVRLRAKTTVTHSPPDDRGSHISNCGGLGRYSEDIIISISWGISIAIASHGSG